MKPRMGKGERENPKSGRAHVKRGTALAGAFRTTESLKLLNALNQKGNVEHAVFSGSSLFGVSAVRYGGRSECSRVRWAAPEIIKAQKGDFSVFLTFGVSRLAAHSGMLERAW